MKNKLFAILLSAVVAIGLWFYVITVVNPESEKTYYEIPVVLQNKNILAERGLMVVSEDPKVTLALRSDRTILNDLNESNINVLVNVANIEKPGVHYLTYSISYPGNIPYNEVSVQSSSTDSIMLKVENRIRKTVPVVIDYGETKVPDGYLADIQNAQLDYTVIDVSGPESVMNQIEQAVIQVSLDGQTKTLIGEYQFALCDKQGTPVNVEKVTVNTEKVNLMIGVERVKEIALKLDVIYGGGATEQTASVTMDPLQIQVSGSDAMLEDLDELVIGALNLSEITEDQTLTFPIVLPEGIENLTGVDAVTVQVKFTGLVMKTFNVTAISAVNVPDGMQVNVITKALSVTIRGPEAMIGAMKETDLTVEVDLAGAQVGTANMTAKVIVPNTFSDAGAVGTYQVSVKLSEK